MVCKEDDLSCQRASTLNDGSTFLESVTQYVPMCSLGYVGTSNSTFRVEDFVPWDLIGAKCQKVYYFIQIVYAVLIALIVVSNICILVVLLHKNHSRNGTLRLYKISLAVADLLVGVASLPYLLVLFSERLFQGYPFEIQVEGRKVDPTFGEKSPSKKMADIAACIFVTSFYASILTLIIAAIDRYSAIRFPFRTQELQLKIAKSLLVGIWVVSLALSSSVFIASRYYYDYATFMFMPSLTTLPEVIIHGFFMIVPLISMWVVNFLTLGALREYNRTSKIRISRGGGAQDSRTNKEKTICAVLVSLWVAFHKMIKIKVTMCTCFTFNLLPTLIMLILGQLRKSGTKSFAQYLDVRPGYHNQTVDLIIQVIDFLSGFSIYLSSLVNGLIYIIRDEEYRQQFKLIILKIQPPNRLSNISVLSTISDRESSVHNMRNSSAKSHESHESTQ